MRDLEEIVKDVIKIYQKSGRCAEEYLHKARMLKDKFGFGTAIVYCWFYSVPQRWVQIEPKIFKLMKYTNSYNLPKMASIPSEKAAQILKPMIFYKVIAAQLKKFCKVVKDEYSSWNNFAKALIKESIFTIFEKLRRHEGVRVTYKNLAAMKIFVGNDDNLLILDTHVAKVLGIDKGEQNKYRIQKKLFESLLNFSKKITNRLKDNEFSEITMAKWSLAIWFNKAGISADELLDFKKCIEKETCPSKYQVRIIR